MVGLAVAIAIVLFLMRAGGRERAELQAVVARKIGADLEPAHADARAVVLGKFAVAVVGEGLLVVALEGFDARQQEERNGGQPRELQALVVEPVGAQRELVDQRLVDEIPFVGMLGVDVAEIAEELAALDLQAEGQAGGFDFGHFHFRAFEVDGGDGRRLEVRIHRPRELEFKVPEVEALVGAVVVMFFALRLGMGVAEAGDLAGDVAHALVRIFVIVEHVHDGGDVRIEGFEVEERIGGFGIGGGGRLLRLRGRDEQGGQQRQPEPETLGIHGISCG